MLDTLTLLVGFTAYLHKITIKHYQTVIRFNSHPITDVRITHFVEIHQKFGITV